MKKYTLPEYPVTTDLWDCLSKEKRPIVVYGMGNGADKLFERLDAYGVKISDVFASDGFVRGHSYRGFKVLSFSEIKEKYDDFLILLSFASNRDEVIELFKSIDSSHDLLIPDMPVAGVDEYFDREHYNTNYEKIKSVYELLCDETSKSIFSAIVNYKLFGRLSYLLDACNDKSEIYSLISERDVRLMLDCGAYNGDTAREALEYLPSISHIVAVEPDRKTFKRLCKYAESVPDRVTAINAALYNECSEGVFSESGNRNSTLSATVSYEHRDESVRLITVDSLGISPDYIKYDVEGAEYEALLGSLETVKHSRPALLVSLYHRSRDMWFLPLFLSRELSGYRFYLRRLRSVPAWELDLILIPT